MRVLSMPMLAVVATLALLAPPLATASPVLTGGAETVTAASYVGRHAYGYDFVSTVDQFVTNIGF